MSDWERKYMGRWKMPNDDYILRSDALKAIRYENWREENRTPSIEELHLAEYQLLAEAINNIPAADVEPVRHGHYIGTEFDGYADGNPVYYEWKCSECDCVFEDDEPKYRYCPHCGAKMDAEPPKGEKED